MFLVEPQETTSDEVVQLCKEPEDLLLTQMKVPFVVVKEEDNTTVSVEVQGKPEDISLIKLVDWTVSSVDKESETCVLSCSLSVDTDELYKMKELPVVQVEVKTKGGEHAHKHTVKLEPGEFNSSCFAQNQLEKY